MCDLDSADSTACLDVCSGYEALIPDIGDFAYRYNTVGSNTTVNILVILQFAA